MNIVTRFFLDFPPPTVTAQESKITVVYDMSKAQYYQSKRQLFLAVDRII